MGGEGWDCFADYVIGPFSRIPNLGRWTDIISRNGPSEFEVTGSQRNWSAIESVKKITVPTLVINGKDEGASDEAVKPFVEGIKDVKWIKFEKSSHMPMYEEPERYFGVVSEFLLGK